MTKCYKFSFNCLFNKLTSNIKDIGGASMFQFRLNHLEGASGTSKNQRH
jgi:hypothetical protein